MKVCSRCLSEKHESEYQIRKASKDGLTASCKKCLSEYDKKRANLAHRVKARLNYQDTDDGKAALRRANSNYKKRNPNKYKAHCIVNNAIRDKKLFRESCEACSSKKTHAHHDDYAKPLNVRWLCAACHRKWHVENGEGLNP